MTCNHDLLYYQKGLQLQIVWAPAIIYFQVDHQKGITLGISHSTPNLSGMCLFFASITYQLISMFHMR